MKTKQEILSWLEQNQKPYVQMADFIWENPETAYKEFKSSKYQADFLEKEGFSVKWDIGGVNTAFVAEWGQGKPIIGFIGEFDALATLSQKIKPTPEPVIEGGARLRSQSVGNRSSCCCSGDPPLAGGKWNRRHSALLRLSSRRDTIG
jgi:hypothetical protein